MASWSSRECSTKNCEHTAMGSETLCRYCQGRRNYIAVVFFRKLFGFKPVDLWAKRVKKSKPKTEPITRAKLKPVAVEDMKVGMTIAQHGKVISAGTLKGRSLWVKITGKTKRFFHGNVADVPKGYKRQERGQEGILFTTERGKVWYPYGATVWTVVK